jgi:hypothetical protein
MSQYIDVAKLDDNQIREHFETAFKAAGEDHDNELRVNEVDVDVVRDINRQPEVAVTVYGLAEVTTQEQFYKADNKSVIKGGDLIKFDIDGKGTAGFRFKGIDRKNSNDYVVTYKVA